MLLSVLIGIAVTVVVGGIVLGCLVLARVRAARRYARRRRAVKPAPSAAALDSVDVTNDNVETLLAEEALLVRSRLAGHTDALAYQLRMRDLAVASQNVPPTILPR